MANWIDVTYPDPEIDSLPERPRKHYLTRLTAVRTTMHKHGLDSLVAYGDREHFANLAFLTGYDPRFEEALFLIHAKDDAQPWLLVGNEGWSYASLTDRSGARIVRCPTFSLQGQPRGKDSRGGASLGEILAEFGLQGHTIGLVGTKTYTSEELPDPAFPEELHASMLNLMGAQESDVYNSVAHDVPSYIVDTLRALAKRPVVNVTQLFNDPSDGLRVGGSLTTAYDIAGFEHATEITYAGARRMMFGLKEGISESEASTLLGHTGHPPLSYHIAVGFGEKHVSAGLGSPDPNTKLKIGDPITFGYGVWGGNTARAGLAVSMQSELSEVAENFVESLAEPYLRCLRDWYRALKIGATGGQVYDAVRWFVEDSRFGVTLNPGHLLHLDEWPSSPFYSGSKDVLKSGVFIQCDIIAAPGPPFHGIHTEDGLVLADANLRAQLKLEFPRVAARIERRRNLMCDVLGYELAPDVLPLCSMQGCVCPFLLAPTRVLCR